MLKYDCSFRRLKRRSKTKNFLSISFSASRWRGGGRRREKNARKFFGFCTRESASVSEAHSFTSPRNRSVRGSFKPPRAPRVRLVGIRIQFKIHSNFVQYTPQRMQFGKICRKYGSSPAEGGLSAVSDSPQPRQIQGSPRGAWL